MQLPAPLVDLVLVHELCHLRVPGHGAAFRREVRLALPDALALERRFEQEEPLLWRGAV
jgi:predicted metal-dependent hydrolase